MESLSGCLNGLALPHKAHAPEPGQFWGRLDLSGPGTLPMPYTVWSVTPHGAPFLCPLHTKPDGAPMFTCVNLLFAQLLFTHLFLLCCCLFSPLKVYSAVNSFRLFALFASLMTGKTYTTVSIYTLWYCVLISMYKIKTHSLVCILVSIQWFHLLRTKLNIEQYKQRPYNCQNNFLHTCQQHYNTCKFSIVVEEILLCKPKANSFGATDMLTTSHRTFPICMNVTFKD